MNYDIKDLNLADQGKKKAEWAARGASMCNYNADYSTNEVVWSWINTIQRFFTTVAFTTHNNTN